MRHSSRALVLLYSSLAVAFAAPPGPDTLIFTDGEKLIGHLESANATSLVFKSDMAGELTIKWDKIQELRTGQKIAVIPKTVKLRHLEEASQVPQGPVVANAQKVEVSPAPQAAAHTYSVSDLAALVPQPAFENAFHAPGLTQGWIGGATAGVSLTEATQKSQDYTAAINLVRAVPSESWLDVSSRTILDFNDAYGKITQPGTPVTKTSLFHADIEEDHYFSPRVFAFGQATFDHNYSQALDLQQNYGGGLGLVAFKSKTQELDFKASVDYIDQEFAVATNDKKLIGSIFSETYVHKFAHNILLNQQGAITPAWNNTNAYSAFASAALTFPAYRHLGFTIGSVDNFLNDPDTGFKKNSFQLTFGATYSLKPPQQ